MWLIYHITGFYQKDLGAVGKHLVRLPSLEIALHRSNLHRIQYMKDCLPGKKKTKTQKKHLGIHINGTFDVPSCVSYKYDTLFP